MVLGCVVGDGASLVDAAQIEARAAAQNDDPTNGLALSKNAHRQFDAGPWSADDRSRVIVNRSAFTEPGRDALLLSSFVSRHLQSDPNSKLRPQSVDLRRRCLAHDFMTT